MGCVPFPDAPIGMSGAETQRLRPKGPSCFPRSCLLLGLPIDLSDVHSCPQCHHELVLVRGLLVPVLIFLRAPTELHPVQSQLCDNVLKSVEHVHKSLERQVVGVEQ